MIIIYIIAAMLGFIILGVFLLTVFEKDIPEIEEYGNPDDGPIDS
jgi:hypothetical protein